MDINTLLLMMMTVVMMRMKVKPCKRKPRNLCAKQTLYSGGCSEKRQNKGEGSFFFFFCLALGVHDLVSPILDVMLTSISDGNMIGLKLQIYFRKW